MAKSIRYGAISLLHNYPSINGMSMVTERSGHAIHETGYSGNRAYVYVEPNAQLNAIAGNLLAGSKHPNAPVAPPSLLLVYEESDENSAKIDIFAMTLFQLETNTRMSVPNGELSGFTYTLIAVLLSDIDQGIYPVGHPFLKKVLSACVVAGFTWVRSNLSFQV